MDGKRTVKEEMGRHLAIGDVELWCAFPTKIDNGTLLKEYRCLLSEEEREQELRMYFARDRHRFLVTRALVRIVLSKYVPTIAPRDWGFKTNRYGKPEISSPEAGLTNLTFNVTHAGELIIVGVARGIALGVDVESVLVRRAAIEIADHFFSTDEADVLRAEPAPLRQQRFFEYWTLKESYIKARGMGLSMPLDKFSFRLTRENGIELRIREDLDDDQARWQFWQFWPDRNHVASICAERIGAERKTIRVFVIVPWVSEYHFSDLPQ